MSLYIKPLTLSIALALSSANSFAIAAEASEEERAVELDSLTVTASADASAEGLSPAFEGGQVAEGGRAGILGTRDHLETPFSITSYTNDFIQDRQAKSVGDVLQADPGVREARGFGNFQESYFIRGFILNSDDIAYNGLYSLLPRQYIATELFERVEVLRGASAFLTGATPSGGGIGGTINLLPKRAPNYPLTRMTVGTEHGEQGYASLDVGRRFGDEQQFGVRVNAAYRDGGTSIEDEQTNLSLFSVGLDYRGDKLRLSADIGSQDNELDETRTNVTLSGVTHIPSTPDADSNWAQPWSYSDEDDVFGTFRAEYDFNDNVTGWAAYGMRRSNESNSLANLTVSDINGDGSFFRFDNKREDRVDTGEIGLRGKLQTGSVGHDWVVSYSYFNQETKNAFLFDFDTFATNLYNPQYYSQPQLNGSELLANSLDPALNAVTKLNSFAIGDTLSFFDDTVLLTLGLRHQTLDVRDLGYDYNNFSGSEYKERELTPALGLVYRHNKQLSVYANYIENLQQGGSVPVDMGYANAGEALEPFVSEQYELGLKYETDSMGYGLAYFTTDRPRNDVDIANNVYGVEGEDNHQGVEFTFYGKATDDIKLLGGVTWLDAEQKDTGDSSIEGNDVIGVAEWQATVGAEWDVPQFDNLALDTRVIYTGSRYADNANTLKVDDWTTVDIGARYVVALGNQDLTLRARVHNLFDRDYWASVGGFPNNGYLVLGAPRTVSLSAAIDFY